jgi:hypothetical protein
MEDHLCPRLTLPQAACLSCLARPQPLAKPQAPRCYNLMNTISPTGRASKRSRRSQAPTQTAPAPRPNYAVQPATLPLPTPPQNTIQQHVPRVHNSDKFAGSSSSNNNITSTALPTPVSHPCEPCHLLYTRLMRRYTGVDPLLRPINSWRDLPTTTTRRR